MNEPKHPHFVLADGLYCHIFSEQLIVGKKELKDPKPVANDKPNLPVIIAVAIGVLISAGFFTATFMIGLFVFTFLFLFIGLLATITLARLVTFSQTPVINRSDILDVKYKKQVLGNDSIIVTYSGTGGRLLRRRFAIYDSEECLNQALRVLDEEGLMKMPLRLEK
ncbi:MAG: hypothetical protein ACRCYO_06380 [Bacteroidia bacterium]